MDGYAIRAADAARLPATLAVIGESAAGRAYDGVVSQGEATRIFTGAPIPKGADAVVIQEDVRREGDRIALTATARAGDNLRAVGLDFCEGESLIPAGRRLTPRDVALAAAANHVDLPVWRRARVAILATGDELVPPGRTPGPSQIIASNNFAVAGVVAACGGIAIDLGIAGDTLPALEQAIRQAREAEADVLVTLGGASVGDHDLVQKALIAAGMELGFWRIAMRPGKPLMHGRLDAMRVLGLPGNPTSSMVCAILFLRPLLRALHGEPDADADPSGSGRLAVDVPPNGPRQDYMRASLQRDPAGYFLATPAASQDSSLVKTMARADGLIVRAPRAAAAKAGDACRVIAFERLGL
jgi:molybdopterin molybdotransferase